MDEMRIDENLLNECLELATNDENMQHRGLMGLLQMVAMMGYRHRSNYRIVLFRDDYEADFDDEYAEYLDLKAQGANPTWPLDRDC
tara:strand:+ start:248 stop:505 length:258 start_codon:yes stop_codon:yes gene_type:complete